MQAASALENLARAETLDGSPLTMATLELEITRVQAALDAGPPV